MQTAGQILTESILSTAERLFDADGVSVMNLRPVWMILLQVQNIKQLAGYSLSAEA